MRNKCDCESEYSTGRMDERNKEEVRVLTSTAIRKMDRVREHNIFWKSLRLNISSEGFQRD